MDVMITGHNEDSRSSQSCLQLAEKAGSGGKLVLSSCVRNISADQDQRDIGEAFLDSRKEGKQAVAEFDVNVVGKPIWTD